MNQLISSIADRAKVLLVSNSPNDVRELLYVLDRHNLGTGLAGDIDEGVELAAGGTDLILLDAALAGTNIGATCMRLRNAGGSHGVPLLLMSATPSAEEQGRSVGAGASDYIKMPFNARDVAEKILMELALHKAVDARCPPRRHPCRATAAPASANTGSQLPFHPGRLARRRAAVRYRQPPADRRQPPGRRIVRHAAGRAAARRHGTAVPQAAGRWPRLAAITGRKDPRYLARQDRRLSRQLLSPRQPPDRLRNPFDAIVRAGPPARACAHHRLDRTQPRRSDARGSERLAGNGRQGCAPEPHPEPAAAPDRRPVARRALFHHAARR